MSDEHCKDCCCARSWAALGITEYTGKGIPEHIGDLKRELAAEKAKCAEYRKQVFSMYYYCVNHPHSVRDIPDEIWVPFSLSLNQ